ncbi:MAG: hypothetical protein ACE5JF_03080 [Anaerolineales bacterium]
MKSRRIWRKHYALPAEHTGGSAHYQLAGIAVVFVGWVPTLVPAAFGVTLLDALEGVLRPAVGKPARRIGVRQLIVSTAFVLVMVLAYLL